ncbi:MAG: autotransporter-associated beta strand repeat-containing protein, partial [Nevskiaceae bacterium]|nr:autotransporter-associated beta strand repeat-containing protein [Nevskiaceae bacterium]
MKTFASAKPGAPKRGICIFPARPGALLCSTALVALLNLAPRAATAQTITQTQTVEGEGESLTLTDEQIVTAGASVVANNGGSVTLNGGSATTTGGATSLLAGRGGANITANDVDISTSHPFPSGATAHGARANSDSTITINGGTITTQSNDSDGLWSAGDGATINATGVTITTHGVRSTGAEFSGSGPTVYGSGLMTLTDVTIATLGNNSYGVASSQSFAVTPGTPLIGPHEVKVVMNGGSITTSGLRSAGLFANSNTTALLSNVTINTSGTQAVGAEGQYAARITLSDVDITTTGLGAYGLYALGDQNGVPTAIFASDVSVLTQGTFAHGLFAMGLANIQLTDGSVTTQGAAGEGLAAAAAIFSRSFSGSSSLAAGPSTISILNSTLISEQGDGILVSNNGFEVPEPTATLNVTLTGSTLTSNTAAWLHAETGTGQIESTLVPVFADVTVDADASNVTGSAVTNEGSTAHVTLRNDSMWTMTGASNLTNFTLDASTLRYGAATTLNVDNPITLDAGGGTVDTNGFSVTLGDVMQGPGALTKTGDGTLLLTAANTYGGGTNVLGGTLQVAAASTSSTDNLGSGGVFIGGAADTPAADGALLIATDASNGADGNFVFEHVLTGTGLLQASNGGGAFDFAPTATVGTAFAGTVALSNNTFTLTDDNTLALTNATLRLDSGNVTTVGAIGGGATSASEMIFGLNMNGGTLVFDDHVPADTEASDIILTTGLLDVSGAGTVRVDVSNFENTPRVIPSRVELPLLEHDDGPPLSLLIQATGNRVTGTGGALTLTDLSSDPVGTATVVGIEQNGEEVAQGTYDFRLTTASDRIDPDGLYVSFALTQLNLMETGDNALALTPATGATGLATDLSAKITGIGDLVIDADPQATGTGLVSLSNTLNDYTGTTFVRSGTLRIDADNALGQPAANQHTAELDLAADTTADLNGHTQTIGSFNGGADSTMALNGGALSIEQGGLSAGVWSGAGAVNLLGGTLQAGSANTFSAAAAMNVANANATLNLAGLNQTVASLSNAGSIRFNSTGSGNTFTPTVLAVNGDYTGNG